MRVAPAIAVVVLMTSPCVGYSQVQAPDRALRDMVESFQTAWNAHDAAGVVAMYADDADQVMDDGPTTVGRQALQQWWAARFAAMEPGRRITLSVSAVRLVTPDVAVINVVATAGGRDAQGQALSSSPDRGTWVVVRRGGRWLIAALRVYSAEHPPAR
jgi:uncharacterized protein (TIGR02246 family)